MTERGGEVRELLKCQKTGKPESYFQPETLNAPHVSYARRSRRACRDGLVGLFSNRHLFFQDWNPDVMRHPDYLKRTSLGKVQHPVTALLWFNLHRDPAYTNIITSANPASGRGCRYAHSRFDSNSCRHWKGSTTFPLSFEALPLRRVAAIQRRGGSFVRITHGQIKR